MLGGKIKQVSQVMRPQNFVRSLRSLSFSVLNSTHHARAQNTPLLSCNPAHTTTASLLPRPAYAHISATADDAGTKDQAVGVNIASRNLDFDDATWVFRHKSTRELLRGLLVLNACAIDPLVNHSYTLLRLGQRLLGTTLLGYVVAPFYNQFVAGDSEEELGRVSRGLAALGVRLMVAPMLETDVGEGHELEELYSWNLQKTVSLVEQSRRQSELGGARPICQTKLTAHLTADVLANISEAYLSLDREGRVDAVKAVADLLEKAEGEGDHWKSPPSPLQALHLSLQDAKDLLDCLPRLHKIGSACVREDVVLAVDAEYTYTNPAINLLTLAMMRVFNKAHTPPLIWNTYQGYLKAGVENLREDLDIVASLGADVGFGAKIVRGAYLERERARSTELQYPDPVNDTYEDTCTTYNRMVEEMMGEIAKTKSSGRQMIVATHNEASMLHAVATLNRLGIDPTGGDVVFGNVYGMADNITIPLAAAGLLVYKSVPCGSVSEVLPYLSRRAAENRAVLRSTRRERHLLKTELKARFSLFTPRCQHYHH